MLSHSRYAGKHGDGVPPWFREFANFCGVNVPTMAVNIPPPAYKVPKILIMGVCEPNPAHTWPLPISTVLLMQFLGQASFRLRTKLELQTQKSLQLPLSPLSIFSRNKRSKHVSSSAGHSIHTIQKECVGSNLGSFNHYSIPFLLLTPPPGSQLPWVCFLTWDGMHSHTSESV